MSAVFFDTDCELWYTQADELGVNVIGMPYTIDDQETFYDFGRNTDFKAFFDKMRKGSMPITSALNPQQYIEIFEPFFARGEEIFYISFSHRLSGTFGHLETALKQLNSQYPGVKFTRFDTLSISVGAGYQVYFGVKYLQAGHTVEETVEFLQSFTKHVCCEFMVDDLHHLHRGGRLSAASAVLGTIMGIKPFLRVTDEGTLEVFTKAKGEKKALSTFMETLAAKGDSLDQYPICLVDADNPEFAAKLEERIHAEYPDTELWHYSIGPVIGTHCGPGTIGLIFHSKQR
jgi:DegV family protein with EDD domain